VIAATRGNHGQGVAWAGQRLGIPVVICVPEGNSPAKNRAMRALGAEVVERGRDYDESVVVAGEILEARGLTLVHSTNNPGVIAGAATITDELLDQLDGAGESIDALVVAVGGGSQAVGALTAIRERAPDVEVYAVQAANAAAIHDGWHAGEMRTTDTADTFADGLATRSCYPMTFGALREGLTGFVTATERELGEAIRAYVDRASTLAEGAGAASLAGLRQLARGPLEGKRVAAILSGGNIDLPVLARIIR
jgi:threonine dehydratase